MSPVINGTINTPLVLSDPTTQNPATVTSTGWVTDNSGTVTAFHDFGFADTSY